jgi:hypothetical protein
MSRFLEDIVAPADYTKDELRSFSELSKTGAWPLAVAAISKMQFACGALALDDGKADYWRGVRDGLDAVFELTESEAANYSDIIKGAQQAEAARDARRNVVYDEEEEETDLTQAISSLGSSSL